MLAMKTNAKDNPKKPMEIKGGKVSARICTARHRAGAGREAQGGLGLLLQPV
jgi:hypothetical protein